MCNAPFSGSDCALSMFLFYFYLFILIYLIFIYFYYQLKLIHFILLATEVLQPLFDIEKPKTTIGIQNSTEKFSYELMDIFEMDSDVEVVKYSLNSSFNSSQGTNTYYFGNITIETSFK